MKSFFLALTFVLAVAAPAVADWAGDWAAAKTDKARANLVADKCDDGWQKGLSDDAAAKKLAAMSAAQGRLVAVECDINAKAPTLTPPPVPAAVRVGMSGDYGGHPSRRGTPRCPPGSAFNRSLGMCQGPMRPAVLSEAARSDLGNCARIEKRVIRRGMQMVEQQRCVQR